MNIWDSLNFEQLGTAGVIVIYLMWQLQQKDNVINKVDAERRRWQERSFTVLREKQAEIMELTRTVEKIIEIIRK